MACRHALGSSGQGKFLSWLALELLSIIVVVDVSVGDEDRPKVRPKLTSLNHCKASLARMTNLRVDDAQSYDSSEEHEEINCEMQIIPSGNSDFAPTNFRRSSEWVALLSAIAPVASAT
ncbi:hypothetical protein EV714DRAFT_234409 [Schizophyllum commune]